ncbi:MAG: hypothetical protein J7497_00470 [Chitinophagaceae bacterium]|nr:hypothetical protein [Chitinophagaceae bacterium]
MSSKATTKKSSKKEAVVTHEVGNYEKHPFFVKKVNKAKAILGRAGLPQQLAAKSR